MYVAAEPSAPRAATASARAILKGGPLFKRETLYSKGKSLLFSREIHIILKGNPYYSKGKPIILKGNPLF